MSTYSFIDVDCSLSGPNGSFLISDKGTAEEGITITATEDIGTMTIGANGDVMHSLHAGTSGRVVIRLLKTGIGNQLMNDAYNSATSSSALYGKDTITIRNPQTGDIITCAECGYQRPPDLSYAKDGNTHEWAFNAGRIYRTLGNGQPAAL